MGWGDTAGGEITVPARHRRLVVDALRLYAAHKRGQANKARADSDPMSTSRTLTALTRSREAADAEALARDVECGR